MNMSRIKTVLTEEAILELKRIYDKKRNNIYQAKQCFDLSAFKKQAKSLDIL